MYRDENTNLIRVDSQFKYMYITCMYGVSSLAAVIFIPAIFMHEWL